MLVPNVFQVVSVGSEVLHVLECTRFANENSKLRSVVSCFVLKTVNTKLVELVFKHFLVQIRDQIWVLLLGWVLWHQTSYWLLDTQIWVNLRNWLKNLSCLLRLNISWRWQILLLLILLHWHGHLPLTRLGCINQRLRLLSESNRIYNGHILSLWGLLLLIYLHDWLLRHSERLILSRKLRLDWCAWLELCCGGLHSKLLAWLGRVLSLGLRTEVAPTWKILLRLVLSLIHASRYRLLNRLHLWRCLLILLSWLKSLRVLLLCGWLLEVSGSILLRCIRINWV